MKIFLPIPGYSRYAITRTGEIVDLQKTRTLIPSRHSKRTNKVICRLVSDCGNISKTFLVHRLVYAAFVLGYIPHKDNLVCHKDGDDTNNDYTNLYLGNYRQNNRDTLRHNHRSSKQLSKISDQDVLDIMVDPRGSQTVARQYGCSTPYVERLRRGVTRRHLTSYPQCPVPYLIPEISLEVGRGGFQTEEYHLH